MTELDEVRRRHGFHPLRVAAVVEETADTRSYVLAVPDDLREDFRYRPGQFCTFRMRSGHEEHSRCYSMSSAPETDAALTVTVKRVPGGVVSNWFHDHVAVGDVLEVTRPSGTFCVRDGDRPVVAFCGGSGVTPVISIAKSVLSSTTRPVAVLDANRDRSSIIFATALEELCRRHPDRFELRHHLDTDGGYLDEGAVGDFVARRLDADFYICGPAPFMDLVESTLLGLGVEPTSIFIERFVTPDAAAGAPVAEGRIGVDGLGVEAAEDTPADTPADTADDPADGGVAVPESIVLILRGQRHEVPYHPGDTVLGTARRAGLSAPYSCEAGNCATCMALLKEGRATMRVNDALTPDEVDEGWILTCQAVPVEGPITVEYEAL